jgi:hypothetical protein
MPFSVGNVRQQTNRDTRFNRASLVDPRAGSGIGHQRQPVSFESPVKRLRWALSALKPGVKNSKPRDTLQPACRALGGKALVAVFANLLSERS